MKTLIIAAAASLALMTPITADAQRATPTPRPVIDNPLVCVNAPLPSDPEVPVTTCSYPSGSGTAQTAQLNDPTVDGHPLLFVQLRDGTRVWAPVAAQLLPNAWNADNGPIFQIVTSDGRYPRCTALSGIRRFYGAVVHFREGDVMVAATTDGNAFCSFPLSDEEVRNTR